MTERLRVLLIFGGRSAEHEVSVVSARSVMAALDPQRYDVLPVGIDKRGRWHLLPAPPEIERGRKELPAVAPDAGAEVELSQEPGASELVDGRGRRRPIDVAFPVLHGPFGEDGTIQGFLELAGTPYVGAGVMASAVGMDKAVQKVLFRAAGLPVAPHEVVHEREWLEDSERVEARAANLAYPVFVKPAALGSSVGVTKVHDEGGLAPAMKEAFAHGPKALVERSMEGSRELEVSVLGNEEPVASVAGEIVPQGHDFYDYDAKYLDEHGARLIVPADIRADVLEEAQRMAVAAFRAIDCAGMARVDLFLTPDGGLVVNEINTIPGFTQISMYPKLWQASGVSYAELVDRLIALAIERHRREARRERAVETGP
ncbi:MAG TPA: D-alanine--D-alanine ligase family protein [Actinomycetota bacterium]|nr:D-alanine--D-alanine ligase family protein [Actinomycetota bacterium]